MSSTIPLNELTKYSDNIYEAIVIIAKRARQINEEQKHVIERETVMDESIDTFDDEDEELEELEEAPVERKIIKLPKPTELAIQEMLAGKIKWDYGVQEEMDEREN
jgi:DNA-directed RNA polymerase subunit K/omega